ncbi:hypothetical protein [Nocardiopsis synnemataformans]|uniref:hypothetical protein n=1 Tax=Nocardiopsis synnemataformans TaxID=61305 RepID=UPI003EBD45E6
MAIKPLSETIPTETAWKEGRRVYVRCGYTSHLNSQLRSMGAKWDPEHRALWVGSTKQERVLPLVLEHIERRDHAKRVKALELWVKIPRGAADLHARARELGFVFDGERKEWAAPSDEARTEFARLAEEYRADAKATRAAIKERIDRILDQAGGDPQEEKRLLAMDVAERAGRTPTGELTEVHRVETRRMRRPSVEAMLHQVGSVLPLGGGRMGVVTRARAWFTAEEVSSVCWHPETHDEPHWDLWHQVAVVEPTEDEAREAAELEAARADAAALHALLEDPRWIGAPASTEYSDVPPEDQVGVVLCVSGLARTRHPNGTVVLTRDGRLLLRHPGYYDSYIATERVVTDAELVGRARSLIEAGARTRTYVDLLEYDYTVQPGAALE